MNDEEKKDPVVPVDGYMGDDDLDTSMEDLDLSFLDEEDSEE